MNKLEMITQIHLADIWLLCVFGLITVYCKSRLEKHMQSKHRWKVLLSATGLLACAAIGAVFYSYTGWTEYAKIMYALNLGAIAVIFFIGFPNLPKKKKK